MTNDLKLLDKKPTEQKVKNYLSGNLCRCTGYAPIIKAGTEIDMNDVKTFESVYDDKSMQEDFISLEQEVYISHGDKSLYLPTSTGKALDYKDENKDIVITSGATDLGVIQNKGKINITNSLSLNNIDQMYNVINTDDAIEFGSKVSLTSVEKACEKDFPEFSRVLHIFASPQIKNAGTLVGNIINASPISDTVPFLRVADAQLKLSTSKKTRVVDINNFIKDGYKQLDLKSNELVESVLIPKTNHKFKLYKVSVRKDLDISTVTFACRFKLQGDIIEDISFAFGGVGAFVIRAFDLEKKAKGKKLNQQTFKNLSNEIRNTITPLSDHRGSAEYRYQLCENLLLKFGDEVIQENGFSFTGASV
jgi:xanthine dehydrogenase small subunit